MTASVDQPLKVALDLTIRGDRMVMDFSRSAPACRGPVNISRSTTIAACYVALKHVFGDVPANAGVLEPIEFVIAEGSILAARAPKPVGGYTETILRLIDLVFQAVAQIAPERSNGCAYGTINALSIAGHRQDGRRWVMFSFFGGGHGGHPEGDGLNHGNAPISTATIPPLEILEAAYPVKFTAMGAAAGFGRAGAASRRAGRDLRDRAAGGGGDGLPVRRPRPVPAAGRGRRRRRGDDALHLSRGRRRRRTRRWPRRSSTCR